MPVPGPGRPGRWSERHDHALCPGMMPGLRVTAAVTGTVTSTDQRDLSARGTQVTMALTESVQG